MRLKVGRRTLFPGQKLALSSEGCLKLANREDRPVGVAMETLKPNTIAYDPFKKGMWVSRDNTDA